MRFTLRPATPADETFLFELYRSTRAEELAAWGWDAAQQESFLRLQFTAQQQHYRAAFDGADHQIILADGSPAGRMLVFRMEREIRLVDISLLPEHRNAGAGRSLINDLLTEAAGAGKSVSLHVERFNRAARLYERLGFRVVEDIGSHFKMEWRPDGDKD